MWRGMAKVLFDFMLRVDNCRSFIMSITYISYNGWHLAMMYSFLSIEHFFYTWLCNQIHCRQVIFVCLMQYAFYYLRQRFSDKKTSKILNSLVPIPCIICNYQFSNDHRIGLEIQANYAKHADRALNMHQSLCLPSPLLTTSALLLYFLCYHQQTNSNA